ncbi:hypothetical protein MMC13_007302 [Lambiella insularis]|nr:hypothetical protein [Lambiella insularis]
MATQRAGNAGISAHPEDGFFTKHPGKAIWAFYAFVTSTIGLSFWLIYYLARSLRPHPKWTYRQAVLRQVVRAVLYHRSVMRIKPTLSLKPGREKDRFVIMAPSKDDVYIGILKDEEIEPAVIGGTWYSKIPPQAESKQPTVLHFHGGAYAIGQGREEDAGYGAKLLLKYVANRVLMPQYRLGSRVGGRFPAALQDAVTSYKYLLDQGIPASSIIISGDSAGGNLVVAFLRHLSDHKGLLPAPSAALLWSPWLDLALSQQYGTAESNHNSGTDYITSPFVVWGANGFIPAFMTATAPYISPRSHPFATETPLWIGTGGGEVLRDENVEFAESMRMVPGNVVRLYEEPHVPHDLFLTGEMLGFETEAENIARNGGSFLQEL